MTRRSKIILSILLAPVIAVFVFIGFAAGMQTAADERICSYLDHHTTSETLRWLEETQGMSVDLAIASVGSATVDTCTRHYHALEEL